MRLTCKLYWLVAAVVQCFYAYRIRVLAQSNIIPMVVVLVKISSSCIFEGLVLIYVVRHDPTSRRNRTRCGCWRNPPFLQIFGREDVHNSWCMSKLSSDAFFCKFVYHLYSSGMVVALRVMWWLQALWPTTYALFKFRFLLGFDARDDTAFQTEIDLETNSTGGSETLESNHWNGDIDRSDCSSYLLEAKIW